MGFGVEGLGFRVWDLGFGVRGLGFRGQKPIPTPRNSADLEPQTSHKFLAESSSLPQGQKMGLGVGF